MENIQNKINELKKLAEQEKVDISHDITNLERKLKDSNKDETWERVQMARNTERPGTLDYARMICDDFLELHGDRLYRDDPSLVGGVGTIDGIPVTIIGHEKGSNFKDNVKRNFGSAHPEGYRKAMRLAKQAEKFNRPVITFIDTQGAYCGKEAEERGIGEAIAVNLKYFSVLKTPVICFVIGEGGSGGALGIGVGDKLYMLENAIYSVISPEGFASILMRDPTKAQEAANILKLTAKDLYEFGIIHGIIPEAKGGVQNAPEITARAMKEVILDNITTLSTKKPEQLIRYRAKKIREVGHFNENPDRNQDLFSIFSKVWGGE